MTTRLADPAPDPAPNPAHWDRVYGAREEAALTWFEEVPARSLALIRTHARPGEGVIDVGGGASRLVDHLLADGIGPVTVLDLSGAALAASRDRLGAVANRVDWRVGDVTRFVPDRTWGVWHDRAVFHFLTDPEARSAYGRAMAAAVVPGGIAIIATFSPDGPETCSGLPVQRWSPEALAAEVARIAPGAFLPVSAEAHVHVTPKGNRQAFQTSALRRTEAGVS
jgi:SAM-dependent methyltransferase